MHFIWYGVAAVLAYYIFGYGSQILQMMSTRFRKMQFRVCNPEEFPDYLEEVFSESIAWLISLGFVEYERQYSTGPTNLEYWTCVLRNEDAKAYALVDLAVSPMPGRVAAVSFKSFIPSPGNADVPLLMIYTVNGVAHQLIGDIPHAVVTDALAPTLEEVWEHHQRVVADQVHKMQSDPVFVSNLTETQSQFYDRYYKHLVEKNDLRQFAQGSEYRLTLAGSFRFMRKVQRGNRAMKALQIGLQRTVAIPKGQALIAPEVEASIYRNLRRSESDALSLTQRLVIFCVTLLLSLFAFSFVFDLETLLIIVSVLLVHEFGHYVAMRITGHQNLSLFFVPLLGAAVQGYKTNATLGERVVVLLAGPMPGILLTYGFLHYVAGSFVGWSMVPQASIAPITVKVVLFAYILNFLNLLPLFPLDGGRVVNMVFFGLHPWIDALLKIAAVLAFAYGVWRFQDPVLLILAFLVIWLVPQNFRQAKALYSLRKHLPISDNVPTDRVTEIYSALNTAGFTDLSFAQRTAYVNITLENWSAFHSRSSTRLLALLAYIVSVGVAVYIIFLDRLSLFN